MSISLKLTLFKKICKTVSEICTDGREMLLARHGDASRHRVVRARGGWSRSCAPPSGRIRWTGSGAILTASTTPLLFAHRSESCPPDGRDARARGNQFGGLRHDDAIAADRSTTIPTSPSFHLVAPSYLDSSRSLFTHTSARIPLAWFHRTASSAFYGFLPIGRCTV